MGFPSGSDSKASVCNAGDLGSIPGLGRSPGKGNGSPLQYSCLEKPMDHARARTRSPSPRAWIKRLHTYTENKHHTRANKFQGKTYQANSPATQEHSPELQDTGCPESPQNHRHLITHYWTLHCTPERRNPAPPTRTPTQASLPRKTFF